MKCFRNCLGPGLRPHRQRKPSNVLSSPGTQTDSDGNQALNTTTQPCTPWLINSTHHLAHWNRTLNPTFAKTQELSPAWRQSWRWMHSTTQLASSLTLSVAFPLRQPGDALAFPSAVGKDSREWGRKVTPTTPSPQWGRLLCLFGGEARLLWTPGSGESASCICGSPHPFLSPSLPPTQV